MLKLKYLSPLIVLLSTIALSAPITVFGPKKYAATLSGATYNSTFQHSLNNAQGVVTLINGDGTDLSPQDCNGLPPVKKALCKAENILRALAVALLRPSVIEVTLNGQVIATSNEFPGQLGKFQKSTLVKSANALKVKVKGSPLATLTVEIKAESQSINIPPVANFSMTPTSGVAPVIVSFSGLSSHDSDGTIVNYAWEFGDGGVATGALVNHLYENPGAYTVKLTVTDNQGAANTKTQSILIQQDTVAPQLTIHSPVPNSTIENQGVVISGEANERLSLTTAQLNGEGLFSLILSADKMSFSGTINTTVTGPRTLQIKAKDLAGNETTINVPFNYQVALPPLAKLTLKSPSSGTAPYMALFDATESSDPSHGPLTYRWDFGDGETLTETSGLVTHTFSDDDDYTITVRVTNAANLSDEASVEVNVQELSLPTDPSEIATPLVENNLPVPFDQTIAFLYEGADAPQKDVQPGTIDPERVSVIRGQVIDSDGNGIPGTKVTVVKGTTLGYTLTRENGFFDIAVNGGANTTVQFEKTGYLPAQRTVRLNYNDYSTTETAILVKADPVVTKIENESPTVQIAKGSTSQDQDGERTAALVIPATTKALVELPNGQTMELPSLSLRMTEYTVAENGPERMPASLPHATSYTYAVDITADEALAMGAKHIRFSKPVSLYVDNFLNFPTGSVIPVGSYDYDKGMWLPEKNGRVLQILSIQNNKAVLDVRGQGSAATAQQLTELGIDDAELEKIAQTYASGKSFWRATATRFSPTDLNVLAASDGLPPEDAVDANDPNFIPGSKCLIGSAIDVTNRSLGETLPLIGTDLTLNYHSKSSLESPNVIPIKLTDGQPPADLQRIDLTIDVAGKHYKQSFAPSANLLYTYTWDGKDAYNRQVDGRTKAKIKIEYFYPSTYLTPLYNWPSEFGMYPINLTNSGVQGRELTSIATTYDSYLGKPATNRTAIGGWQLPIYHSYDPQERTLYMGNGQMIGGMNPSYSTARPIEVVIGGAYGFSPDGTVGKEAKLITPHPVLYGSDRSVYFSDGVPMVRRVRPDGILETIAGTGDYGYTGDGGPATDATFGTGLNSVQLVEGEDKEFYIADIGNCVIRKINKNGIISTIAGTGTCGPGGEDGSALQTRLGTMFFLTYHEGSLFTIETDTYRIREITAGGLVRTVLGTGQPGLSPDGTPAIQADINYPTGIAFSPNGELIFSEVENHRIRKIDKFGNIQTILGTGTGGNSPDGTPVAEAEILWPVDVRARTDGSVYYRSAGRDQIRYLSANGTLQTLVGTDQIGVSPDGELALHATLSGVRQFDFSPEGDIYVVEQNNNRIIKITDALNLKPDENGLYTIPSSSGDEVYVFDRKGLHKQTLYGKTGSIKYNFIHDVKNQLIQIVDGDNNITHLNRNSDGQVTDIVSPYGQTTTLAYNNKLLSSLELPSGAEYGMAYSPKGLLTEFVKPNGAQSTFQYDTLGRLVRDTNAAGGFTHLSAVSYPDFRTAVIDTSAEGVRNTSAQRRTENYSVVANQSSYGGTESIYSYADGRIKTVVGNSFYEKESSQLSNPRLGSPALEPSASRYSSLDGFRNRIETSEVTYNRLISTFDFKLTQTNLLNGALRSIATYDSADRTLRKTSAENRTTISTIDANEKITTSKVGSLLPTTYSYDNRGRLENMTQGTRVTQFSYGNNGLVSSMTDQLGRQTSYEYDENLRKTKDILPGGREINYDYDANGNLIKVTPPGKPTHSITFDIVDLMRSYLPAGLSGSQYATTYEYNLDNKVTSIQKPGRAPMTYSYSPSSGALQSLSTSEGAYNYTFTLDRQPKTASSPDNLMTNYNYFMGLDAGQDTYTGSTLLGRYYLSFDNSVRATAFVVNINNNPQSYTMAYDQDELLTTIGNMHLSYDENSLISNIQLGGIDSTISYNSFGEPLSETTLSGSTPLSNQIYSRDALGRITQKIDDGNTFDYTYDSAGRLYTVTKNNAEIGRYTYDLNGNRTQAIINGQTLQGTFDVQDRLLTYGTKSYTYSDAGDLTSITDSADNSERRFSYNSMGALRFASVPGKNIQYLNGADNSRVRKYVNGQLTNTYLYQSQLQVVAELDNSGNLLSTFIYGSKANSPDYMVKGGVNYRLLHDQLGSIRKVIHAGTGQVVQEMTYDEFGKVLSDTNPGFQPFGFAGGLYDRDTGFVKFGARDYDPETGRWTSRDPILFAGGDSNLYAYVGNDPVNAIDPSGLTCDGTGKSNVSMVCGGAGGNGGGGSSRSVVYVAPNGQAARAEPGAVVTTARNGRGLVIQQPNSQGGANTIRLMEPTSRYPEGYGRTQNSSGQYTDIFGNPVDKYAPEGHICPRR